MSSLETLKKRYFGPSAMVFDESTEILYFVDGRSYFKAIRDAIAATVTGDQIYSLGWWFDPNFQLYGGLTPPTLPLHVKVGDLLADRKHNEVDVRIILNGAQYLAASKAASFQINWDALEDLLGRVPPGAATPPLAGCVVYD
ncbi:hypothetical protein [Frankia sp. Cppng1_Ct_nod]|uniref:hypothetical protein n=1 Tax=Frankia sp. Cppng1_Ct_nod TaxID=2897162 RepID=UPI002024B0BC|nr:hypothetical protein [Frankia sp. Cppng1_Ct_nod]